MQPFQNQRYFNLPEISSVSIMVWYRNYSRLRGPGVVDSGLNFNWKDDQFSVDSQAACGRGVLTRPWWTLMRPTSWTMSILLKWTVEGSPEYWSIDLRTSFDGLLYYQKCTEYRPYIWTNGGKSEELFDTITLHLDRHDACAHGLEYVAYTIHMPGW